MKITRAPQDEAHPHHRQRGAFHARYPQMTSHAAADYSQVPAADNAREPPRSLTQLVAGHHPTLCG